MALDAPWAIGLLPASWRGVPFAVRDSSIRTGRKQAVHEYPYRDDVWVEDLGLDPGTIGFRGFIVGDDIQAQKFAMLAAAQAYGPGVLVHPSLGSVSASLVDFSINERADYGGAADIEFAFKVTGQALYPSAVLDTQGAVALNAVAAGVAVAQDFALNIANAARYGASVVQAGVATVQTYTSAVRSVVNDASMLQHAVTGLPGNYGRYSTGNRTGLQDPLATVDSTLADVTHTTNTVAQTTYDVERLASLI